MPRQQHKPIPSPKPNLKVIHGALALYRVGDVVTFELDDIQFEEAIESIEVKDGDTVMWVTVTVGLHPCHIKRVERRSM